MNDAMHNSAVFWKEQIKLWTEQAKKWHEVVLYCQRAKAELDERLMEYGYRRMNRLNAEVGEEQW